ncbi:MAG: large subunit ribosomal protein L6 [Flavobacteriaceae bacterium]|jgi:large subunit ribosomal protein L6
MSRLAKRPIEIVEGVTLTQEGTSITVKGPKGELTRDFTGDISIVISDKEITLTKDKESVFTRALWGTYASHLVNMMEGVTKGFEKKLIIEGVGFKSEVKGNTLVMALGFSHDVEMAIPEGLTITAEKNHLTISGINKETVGAFTSEIRMKKKPEPYKGKGIRYVDEIVRRKQGKKNV